MPGCARAIPTIGVVTLLFRWQPLSVWPVLAGLTLLAIPPVMLNTAAGIDSVDPEIRDAANGMGLTGWQSLWQVEVPNALPLMLAGIRSAANQVIATATVAGFVGLGSLGMFIYTGYSTPPIRHRVRGDHSRDRRRAAVEVLFAVLQRTIVSPGVRERRRAPSPDGSHPGAPGGARSTRRHRSEAGRQNECS